MHLRVNTNDPFASTINILISVVYSENGRKVEKSSKTTDTMNRTILVNATNQNPASICALKNTIQYNTIQYNTIQYNTIQYNTIQYNTIHTVTQ